MPWALFESDFCFEKKFNLTWKKKKKKKKLSIIPLFNFCLMILETLWKQKIKHSNPQKVNTACVSYGNNCLI